MRKQASHATPRPLAPRFAALALALAALALNAAPAPALGGDVASVEQSNVALNGALRASGGRSAEAAVAARVTSRPSYDAHAYQARAASAGVREFVDRRGQVFAVAWSGALHPDPQILMGAHYTAFRAALAEARKNHFGHGPITIERDGLHLELGGHAMSMHGRAWLISNVPAGMDPNEIQ